MELITNPFTLLWIRTFGKKKYEKDISDMIDNMGGFGDARQITTSLIDANQIGVIDLRNKNDK